jgi:uncharacterized protein YjeT (DUF2065 family)
MADAYVYLVDEPSLGLAPALAGRMIDALLTLDLNGGRGCGLSDLGAGVLAKNLAGRECGSDGGWREDDAHSGIAARGWLQTDGLRGLPPDQRRQ